MNPPVRRVLCAEANDDIRGLLKLILSGEGCVFVGARSVCEAEAEADDGFCLFIVGEGFADGTTLELVRRLRVIARGTPVLVYSTQSFEESRLLALEAGASLYVVKPGDPEQLRQSVRQFCGLRRAGAPNY